ncbi:MAG: energy transducer TonB [Flavobacteriales bacterium]|nr:energy transducer TonB [Flavobacteriales bacterium]
MKKIIAIIFCVVTSFAAFAADGVSDAPSSPKKEISKAINKVMTYPILQNQKMQGTVEVSFKIDDDGKVDILQIESSNPDLIDYVVQKLKKIKLKEGKDYNGQTIRYKFVFKKEA